MDDSPGGREIEEVKGTPSGIIKRGEAIKDLGEQMREAAHKLEGMKNNSLEFGGQEGKAIDSLADTIGDSYEVLYKAADLYEPVGPVILTYGNELEDVQPLIKSAVSDCESLWETYESLPGDVEPRGTGGLFEPDADSPEADAQAKEDQAKKQAYEDWKARAEDFDSHYDTWEGAFDDAVAGITDGTADSIEDSFWSDVTDFLEVAALIIGVAALIIGGPIMAAIALAVGALLLIATIGAYLNGERSGQDVALAVVGVIPFGKVSSLTKLAHLGRGASTAKVLKSAGGVSGLKGLSRATSDLVKNGKVFHADGLVGAFRNRGAASGMRQILSGSPEGLRSVTRTHRGFYEGAGPVLAGLRNSRATSVLAGVDFGSNLVSTTLRNVGYADKIPGVDTPEIPFPIQLAF